MEKNLKYFMRPEAKDEQTVFIPAPPSIVDEKGERVQMEVRLLSTEKINDINDKYTTRRMATDRKGKPIVSGGEVAVFEKRDSSRASRHIIVEALKYPNLKDPALMEYYDCVDITDMPLKVFPTFKEYDYVSHSVLVALGLIDENESEDEDSSKMSPVDAEIEDAKN